MKLEDKALWIEALQSGQYKKGLRRLKVKQYEETRYCCLGVLCEIMKFPSEVKNWFGLEYQEYVFSFDALSESSNTLLPSEISNKLGLNQNGSFVIDIKNPFWLTELGQRIKSVYPSWFLFSNQTGSLTELNDSNYFSFEEIAEVIKAHL